MYSADDDHKNGLYHQLHSELMVARDLSQYGHLNESDYEDYDPRELTEVLINNLGLETILKAFVDMDFNERGLESWDVKEYRYDTSLEKLIRDIDGGYGITKINLTVA